MAWHIKKKIRSRQDSNLRGETPLDFKSNALTTRPRLQYKNVVEKFCSQYVTIK